MFSYRITKYNPIYRNERGAFLKDEWISYSDIGSNFDGELLMNEQYKKIEDAYIGAILFFMKCMSLKGLIVSNLEKLERPQKEPWDSQDNINLYNLIKNNQLLDESQIVLAAQLTLRNNIWCMLESEDMFVHFGYDYYMYIGSQKACPITIFQIEQSGLFVEEFESPYLDQPEEDELESRSLDEPEEENEEYIH